MSVLAGAANEGLHRVLAQVRRYGAIGPRQPTRTTLRRVR